MNLLNKLKQELSWAVGMEFKQSTDGEIIAIYAHIFTKQQLEIVARLAGDRLWCVGFCKVNNKPEINIWLK